MTADSMFSRASLPLVLLLLAAAPHCVAGHGYLSTPKSRNFFFNSDYCPHCLSAGGPIAVGGGKQWPERRGYGICGDPYDGPRKHEAGGMYARAGPTATYLEGQVVQFETVITAFHKGRIGYRICKVFGLDDASERQQLTEQCLDQHVLVQADVPGAQNPGDPWQHLGQVNVGSPCPWCLVEGTIHTTWYKLPDGLTCDGVTSKCILQWYWLTGNTCNPPGEGLPWGSLQMDQCGRSSVYPEEFWNCADILINPASPGDAGRGASPSPGTPVQSPTPIPSPEQLPEDSPKPAPTPSPLPNRRPPCAPGNARCFCRRFAMRDGFFPDLSRESRCKSYYTCTQGRGFYTQCPTHPLNSSVRLRFNSETLHCDFPRNVYCPPFPAANASLAPPSPPPPPPPPSPPPPAASGPCPARDAACFCKSVPPTGDGIFPDTEGGCAGFFLCTSAASQYVPCAAGTAFDAALGYCNWADAVVCPRTPTFVAARAPLTPSVRQAMALGTTRPQVLVAARVVPSASAVGAR